MRVLLDEEEVSTYRILIGSMNWAVALGKIDVMFVANILAKYSCAPRHGQLKTAFRAFGYLKHHSKGVIEFDTLILEDIDKEKLNKG